MNYVQLCNFVESRNQHEYQCVQIVSYTTINKTKYVKYMLAKKKYYKTNKFCGNDFRISKKNH